MADSMDSIGFTQCPPVFVVSSQIAGDQLHELEDQLVDAGVRLTYDINEAEIIISHSTKRARIQFDLRSKGLWTKPIKALARNAPSSGENVAKRQRFSHEPPFSGLDASQAIPIDDDSSTASESGVLGGTSDRRNDQTLRTPSPKRQKPPRVVTVVTSDWFQQSLKHGSALPLDAFVLYRGECVQKTTTHPADGNGLASTASPHTPNSPSALASKAVKDNGILARAKEDAMRTPSPGGDRFGRRRFGQSPSSPATEHSWSANSKKPYAHLLHRTTTEEEGEYSTELPKMPEWVTRGIKYACQRQTPKDSPNAEFIGLLKKIRLARTLTNDEIGVRAYSTSIASIAAYPYKLSNPRELLALPGCEGKIANLFVEWANTGTIRAVEDMNDDPDMKVLRLFYEIWGVGASTAREFYFDRGWRDLDDIVEQGWATLTRVQQIGVKFYDEFLDPIPRSEVEKIGRVVHDHAVRVRDDKIQTLLVGGYRRGKEASGDVDIIVSHPDEEQTANIINDIVSSLEDEGWITHTLTLSMNNTKREQKTLPFRSSSLHGGASFDSLDKALVVWQNPVWETQEQDLAIDPNAKNPNIHRRVDIIISPWRTVGCAVLGWSGATTFERDLRRYAKNVKGWKFDSSGVRDRATGEVVDLEGFTVLDVQDGTEGRAKTMIEAERRVFDGFGLEYREPWERCTE